MRYGIEPIYRIMTYGHHEAVIMLSLTSYLLQALCLFSSTLHTIGSLRNHGRLTGTNQMAHVESGKEARNTPEGYKLGEKEKI